MSAFQILDECPNCRVESALAAVYDPHQPCSLLGVAAESTCRLCGRRTTGRVEPECPAPDDPEGRMRDERCPRCGDTLGEDDRLSARCSSCGLEARERVRNPGARFTSLDQLEGALGRWARLEGSESTAEFVESSFLDGELGAVFARLEAGERVETNFDVLAFLFPEIAMAAAVPVEIDAEVESPRGSESESERTAAPTETEPVCRTTETESESVTERTAAPTETETESESETERMAAPTETETESESESEPVCRTTESEGPRVPTLEQRTEAWAPLLPLVSVMVADGRVHPAEEAFLNPVLARHRYPPIPAEHVRVHRPETVPVSSKPEARRRMVEAMVHLVHVDRLRDGTEFRVVEEYARAWGVDPARVARWDQLYRKRYATGMQRLWLILESVFVKR